MGRIIYLGVVTLIMCMEVHISHADCTVEGTGCDFQVTCKAEFHRINNLPDCKDAANATFVIQEINKNILSSALFSSINYANNMYSIETNNSYFKIIDSLAFKYFSNLKRIDLSYNNISVIKDEAFKSLPKLEYLNVSNNLINELKSDSLRILKSQMKILDLSYNNLSYISDKTLSFLPLLTELYLQENKLMSIDEKGFSKQILLTSLYLQHNRLGNLNSTLNSLKRLKTLDVSYNAIISLCSESKETFDLENVNATHNLLQKIDTCIMYSPNMTIVDLSYNSITYAVEKTTFSQNLKLKYLDLSHNHIPGIEANSFINNVLDYFNVKDNKISYGEINKETFAGLKNITELDLSNKSIKIVRDFTFTDLKALTNLNLSRNNIKDIEIRSFGNTSVNVLDISHNKISELSFLVGALYDLTELYLHHNDLTILKENTLIKHTSLHTLDLSDNKITTIEKNSLPLESLKYLNIRNNRLSGVLAPNMFSPAKNLKSLDLSNSHFTIITNLAFTDMPLLESLNISHSNINKITPNNFRGMDKLTVLDMSNNALTELKLSNSLSTELKTVYLNNNKLTDISTILPTNSAIQHLDISNNDFSDLSYLNSNLLPKLETLSMSYNNVKKLNVSLNDVSSLNWSHNKISDIPPETFRNMQELKELNLSGNDISSLKNGTLKGLKKLEALDLSNNTIEAMDVSIFNECEKLKTLVLNNNHLKYIDVNKLKNITHDNIGTLSITGNFISCEEFANNTRSDVSDVFEVQCDPERTIKPETSEKSGHWKTIVIVILVLAILVASLLFIRKYYVKRRRSQY